MGCGKKLQAALLSQKYGLVNSKYLPKVPLAAFCCLGFVCSWLMGKKQ